MKPIGSPAAAAASSAGAAPWWSAPEIAPDLELTPFEPSEQELRLASRVERHTRLGHFRIPQVPRVATEAIALLALPDADPADISRLIHRDQQLAADAIAFANSALFAGTAKATNIPEAIMRVGLRRTRSLVFAASLRAVVYSGCEIERAELLWRHACGCAAIAARIAQNVGRGHDDLYLAGLFHDVGKTVVLSLLDAIALRSQHRSLRAEFVDDVLEAHHERVGTEVAIHWNLPDEVVDVIQCHTEAGDRPLSVPQAIVTLANNACYRLGVGVDDDGRPIAGPIVLRALGAGQDDLERILDGVPESLSSI
jgi:putative nucleotidyltransferase with HDIG domain